ncbi:MAG TPA: tagaturonate reductase [Candidatus Limiplasma sp.]|nr:tagaturonate reductase [Candidatus Limiplasma sp.]
MKRLSAAIAPGKKRSIKVLQFGEGNFLRAFVDYMLDIANECGRFDGDIVIVKPIPYGSLERFHDQDCRYTVLLRGMEDGKCVEKTRIITSVQDAVDCYTEYDQYAEYARLDSLRFIVSNTTEAGIVLDEEDQFTFTPPHSYPGKLTKFLFERAEAFDYSLDKGLIILPVELIDDNGIVLRQCVHALAAKWKLGERFTKWLDDACIFTSTLVDRIVTGYPRDEAEAIWQKLGYEDQLLDTAEPFGLWVIESQKDIRRDLPLPECGLPVLFTDNQKPYKQRKVRILNGAHTSFVPMAYLCGHDIVLEAMQDPMIKSFILDTLQNEVIPTLTLPKDDLVSFAQAVISRFENPFIKHSLLAISLNSVSKWRARCMPSFLAYIRQTGTLPSHLTFSIAALMALYQGSGIQNGVMLCKRDGKPYEIRDDAAVLQFFVNHSGQSPAEQAAAFLSNESFWGQDLAQIDNLTQAVAKTLADILQNGMQKTVAAYFTKN